MTAYCCIICNHDWFPRSFDKPKRCPNCQTINWDKEGKRKKYCFGDWVVGEERTLPWYSLPNGQPDLKSNVMRNRALSVYQSQTGRKFTKKPLCTGLEIRRVS